MFPKEEFAKRLRALHAETGKPSLLPVAQAVGVDRTTIGRWFTGKTMPPADAVYELAELYSVSSDYLLCRSDFRIGLPPDEYLVDEEKLAGLLAARTRPDLIALSEPVSILSTSGKPVQEAPGISWAAKVPRRPRIVSLTEHERLRSEVAKAVKEACRADRTGGN